MKLCPIGYELYSAREEAAKDLDAVLSRLSALGYEGVEFAGFYGHSAKDIRHMLKKHHLKALASHVPVAEIEKDMQAVIDYHLEIGCDYIAVPYLDEQSRPGTPRFADILQLMYRFGRKCRKAGLHLLYHNHDFEFVELSGMTALDFIYAAIPENLLGCEIDTCWVRYSGVDPAEYLRKYKGRCPVVHVKDFTGRRTENPPYALIGLENSAPAEDGAFSFQPVGYGCQDIPAIVAAAMESGAKWLVVEQDESKDRPPLEAAKLSLETLEKLKK